MLTHRNLAINVLQNGGRGAGLRCTTYPAS